jgi:hypothetical protein
MLNSPDVRFVKIGTLADPRRTLLPYHLQRDFTFEPKIFEGRRIGRHEGEEETTYVWAGEQVGRPNATLTSTRPSCGRRWASWAKSCSQKARLTSQLLHNRMLAPMHRMRPVNESPRNCNLKSHANSCRRAIRRRL